MKFQSMGYHQFSLHAFQLGASYVEPQYNGIKGAGRILISATAVDQTKPKVIAVWIRGKGAMFFTAEKK